MSSSSKPQVKRRGEIAELQDSLNSTKIEHKREAVRKIIDAMTRGKDVSMLYPDIVKNMETNSMELKKLIYLYIINYSKIVPDMAILAINSFRKDANDKQNPLLRALAVRTMGCIRVKQITEYLLDPLKNATKDEDSYVRKTAAVCIAKLYDDTPELMEDHGFLKMLENLVNDGNAMVVANAICAQMQIQDVKGEKLVNLTPYTVQKILTAINESNEWGIIYLLDALCLYQPSNGKEVEQILERVSSRLSHQNPGVVLATTRVIMKYLDLLTNAETVRNYCRRLTAPLLSLLQGENEIQYVALKNINLIIQKKPMVIEKEIKVFFCNFNDPSYIKQQKLEILVRLVTMDNILQILHELKEYTSEVDVEFVRKSIRAIGRCAIKLEKAADKCVKVLVECLQAKVQYIIYETIIVIRDIFRKYPRQYEAILKDLCDNLKIEDSEAKASMIWIIGEYSETIANADELLTNFAETFKDEQSVVQHSILISSIKLFLLRPNDGYTLVQDILRQCTQEIDDPDLRDRGYIYFRLLNIDPELAKKIVFTDRPAISDQSYTMESEILDKLLDHVGNLASVYYKPPQQFVKKLRDIINSKVAEDVEELELGAEFLTVVQKPAADDYTGVEVKDIDPNISQFQSTVGQEKQMTSSQMSQSVVSSIDPNENLLDLDYDETPSQTQSQIQSQTQYQTSQQPIQTQVQNQPQTQQQPKFTQPNVIPSDPNVLNIKIPFNEILSPAVPSVNNIVTGLKITGAIQRENDKMYLYLTLINQSQQQLSDFLIKLSPNSFKIAEVSQNIGVQLLEIGQTQNVKIELHANGVSDGQVPATPFRVNGAIKTNLDIFAFTIPCSMTVLLVPGGQLTPQQYIEYSQKFNKKAEIIPINTNNVEKVKQKLQNNNFNLIGVRKNPQGVELYSFSAKCVNEVPIIFDAILDLQTQNMNAQIIAHHPSMLPLILQALTFIFKF